MTDVRSFIQQNESLRLKSYDDATGEPLEAGDVPRGTCSIGYGNTGPDVVPGLVISHEEAEIRLSEKLAEATTDARALIGSGAWDRLDEVRRAALIDLAYQIGRTRAAKFVRLITAVRRGDWQRAHDEMMRSKVAVQTPSRTARRARMLLTGEWG